MQHLPMFLASAPVFPNTHTQITSNPTDMIKLNAIVAGHRRFCIAWQDPNTRVISHVGCLVQVRAPASLTPRCSAAGRRVCVVGAAPPLCACCPESTPSPWVGATASGAEPAFLDVRSS